MIEYKGYIGVVEFDAEIDLFHGAVININDVISFYGASVDELRQEMRKSVDEYVAFCQEQGHEPEKPFSGKLVIHTKPDLHKRLTLAAAKRQVSVDDYVAEVLEKSA